MPPAIRDAFLAQCHAEDLPRSTRDELETVARKSFGRIGARLFRRDLTDAEISQPREELHAGRGCRRLP